jgi:hypothetical protein
MTTFTSTILTSGQYLFVSGSDEADYTTAYTSAFQFVDSGGFANGTNLSGGIEYVWSGGSDLFSNVYSGGLEYVYGGGVSDEGFIWSGGSAEIFSGSYASGYNIASGGAETIYVGGLDEYGSVWAGGYQEVDSGGEALQSRSRRRRLVHLYQQRRRPISLWRLVL